MELSDYWFRFWQTDFDSFYSVEEGEFSVRDLYPGNIYTSGRYYNIFFQEHEDNDTYQRHVTTLWDIISDVGGVVEILFVFFGLLTLYQSFFLYQGSLIKRLFKIETLSSNNNPLKKIKGNLKSVAPVKGKAA